jgi:hypothetical protein
MRIIFTTLLCLFITVVVTGQVTFQKLFTGASDEYCYSVQQTADGGFILAGETDTYGAGSFDAYLIKTDSTGTVQWVKTYGDTLYNWANSVRQTFDGGYIVTGGTEVGSGDDDIWVFKTDASGNIVWQLRTGSGGYDNSYDVRQTADSGYVVCGYQSGGVSSADVAALVKLSPAGMLLWSRVYAVAAGDAYAYSMIETPGGGFAVCGEIYDGSLSNGMVIRTDASGTVQWAHAYTSTADFWINSILPMPGGNYAVAGQGSQPTPYNIWLARLDGLGMPTWSKTYAGPGLNSENCFWAARTSDGGFALCGRSDSFSSDDEGVLLKTDSSGNLSWARRIGGTGDDRCVQVVETTDGGYAMACGTNSFVSGESAYLVKTYPGVASCNETPANFTVSSVMPVVTTITPAMTPLLSSTPTALAAAAQTFTESLLCSTVGFYTPTGNRPDVSLSPNPFRTQVVVRIQDSHGHGNDPVFVRIMNAVGERVYAEAQLRSDGNAVALDLSHLANGIYFAEIRSGSLQKTIRLSKSE